MAAVVAAPIRPPQLQYRESYLPRRDETRRSVEGVLYYYTIFYYIIISIILLLLFY